MSSSDKRFLFATDFSTFSDHALEHALYWSKAFGAALDCVHVIAVHRHLDLEGAVIETFLEEERKVTKPKFEALVSKIQKEGGACVGHYLTGIPDEVISQLALETGADCIFMGTRGWRGMDRILLGSTAERVVMTAPCPVLTVRTPTDPSTTSINPEDPDFKQSPQKGVASGNPPSHILVPIDLYDSSKDAVEYTFEVTSAFNIPVTLLHVRDPITYSLDFTLTRVQIEKEKTSEIEHGLRDLCRRFQEKGQSASYLLKTPPTPDAILQTLEECGANLIIMGTHGRRGFSRLLMGSVASAILRKSPVPVLTVKAGIYASDHPRLKKESTPPTS